MAQVRLSLTALRALDVVSRLSSMSRAARELDVTPSAVSQLISTLERNLGVRLVDRGGSKVTKLTPAGQRYARRLRSAFRQIDRATERLAEERPLAPAPPGAAQSDANSAAARPDLLP